MMVTSPSGQQVQDGDSEKSSAHAVALTDQADQALTGDDAHSRPEAMEDDERNRRQQQHPQQLVSVLGAQHRVRRDAGRVII
jgi:hypothetical protein